MTARKHFKALVRARMAKTGERYSTARRQVLRQAAEPSEPQAAPYHFPGSIPAVAALRSLLTQAGARDSHRKAPFSEAMVFGIAGGIGAGMFAFHYAKENFSSFYLAGRHLWQDHLAWARGAARRLALEVVVKESSGLKPAEQQLRELLAGGRPVLAWVDGYRVVAVHAIDDAAGVALLGEAADEPATVALAELAASRARIKSYKNRLLALEPDGETPELGRLVREGLGACAAGLGKGKMKNFTLESFATWADRLAGSKATDSWEKVFPPGPHLYTGLRAIHEHIEYSGTGGGLCRPLFAEFLGEAAAALKDSGLAQLSGRYARLGDDWSALADAALPDRIAEFQDSKLQLARKAEALHSSAGAELISCEAALAEFRQRMAREFPLDAAQCAALRNELQARVRELAAGERKAVSELEAWLKQ
jgi:hypothetical protein